MDEFIVINPDDAGYLLDRGYIATITLNPNGKGIAWAFPVEAKEDLKHKEEN